MNNEIKNRNQQNQNQNENENQNQNNKNEEGELKLSEWKIYCKEITEVFIKTFSLALLVSILLTCIVLYFLLKNN